MNRPILWLSLCLGTLGSTLATLPCSAQNSVPADTRAVAQFQAKLQQIQSDMEQTTAALGNREELLAKLGNFQQPQTSDDQNVEVFVGSGGSWLGIETHEVTSATVKDLKLPAERGALVGKIIPESPAAKAGLKEHDVITELDGQRVEGTAQFRRMIREIPAGRTAQLTIVRDGHSENLNVILGSTPSKLPSGGPVQSGSLGSYVVSVPFPPDIENLEQMSVVTNPLMGHPRIGIDAEDLRGALGNYFGAPDGEGILVRTVFGGSPAEKAGFKAGDVITSVDGKRIRTISDLRDQLKVGKLEGKTIKIGVLRNKAELTLAVNFPAAPKSEVHAGGERSNL